MSQWNESRGVWDDVCYLRQAHLFQRFGLDGLNTDISRDDDRYVSTKLKEIGYPTWNDPMTAPCHIFQPATQKLVMQYPPGTGLVLALFPPGFQVIPLYVLATIAVSGFGLLAIARATSIRSILMAAVFADVAVYLMINPTKSSFSMAPTMVVCALGGFLTARLFAVERPRHRLVLTLATGFVIGLAVNFRLANLFLSAGYFAFFGLAFLRSRKFDRVLQGGLFGIAYLVGIAPTLIANAINAGSPFKTTYGGADLAPPEFDLNVLWSYLTDMQLPCWRLRACGLP